MTTDLFFDFSGPQTTWPANYRLLIAVRLGILTAIVLTLYVATYRRKMREWSLLQVTGIVLILFSIVMSMDYLVFQVSTTVYQSFYRADSQSIHVYYGVTAALVFLLCEIVGVIELSAGKPSFIKWIAPAALYLCIIGIV